jgi:hypothetical protein
MDSLSEKELRVQGSGFRKRRKKKAMEVYCLVAPVVAGFNRPSRGRPKSANPSPRAF